MSQAHPHEDAIRERAYLIWEAEGKPHGREQEFWQRAVVALSSKEKLATLPKAAPKAKAAKPEKPAKAAAEKPAKAAASKSKAAPAKAETAKKPKKK